MNDNASKKVTAADILKEVPITRKTLWLWQKKYQFFPDPEKVAHPGGKGIVGYYPAWVKERCKRVYALQKSGYTIMMIREILQKETEEQTARKILIVDDEKKFTNLMKKFLVKKGYQVEVAYDGLNAGLKAAEFKPAIILLDIHLPGLNGLEVCKHLKSNPQTQNTRILVISASLQYTDEDVRQAGGDGFLKKPVNLQEVGERCDQLFGARQETALVN